jgi:hypothetical protein
MSASVPTKVEQKMTYGTQYFRSMIHAAMYYTPQYGRAGAMRAVEEKVKRGEIKMGMPPLRNGESCFLIDGGTRWAINTNK